MAALLGLAGAGRGLVVTEEFAHQLVLEEIRRAAPGRLLVLVLDHAQVDHRGLDPFDQVGEPLPGRGGSGRDHRPAGQDRDQTEEEQDQ